MMSNLHIIYSFTLKFLVIMNTDCNIIYCTFFIEDAKLYVNNVNNVCIYIYIYVRTY